MIFKIIILVFVSLVNIYSQKLSAKPLQVVTTIPDLAWVIERIGKDKVSVKTMLKGSENPHYVDAVPNFILWASNADLFCFVGADLEIGYVPAILKRAANNKIQSGSNGYCDASNQVDLLDKITTPVDRSMGDIHPHGNPHFYLSPTAMKAVGREVTQRLEVIDPQNSKFYQSQYNLLVNELDTIRSKILAKFKNYNQAIHVMEYHKEFSYFIAEYGLTNHGAIEDKPGVPPSAQRLVQVAKLANDKQVQLVLSATYNPKNILDKFSSISGIPYVSLPAMLNPSRGLDDYIILQEQIASAILLNLKQPNTLN